MTNQEKNKDPNYLPPLKTAIPFGIQHVLAMFAGNIATPIIMANVLGVSLEEKVMLIQVAMLIAGITTMIQTFGIGKVGARLPIVMGTSFAFVPVLIFISNAFGTAAVFGSTIVCGITQFFLGTVFHKIKGLFPPLVSGLVIMVVGLLLLPVAIRYAGGHPVPAAIDDYGSLKYIGLATFTFVLIFTLRVTTKGFVSMASVFLGMIAGYLVSIPFGIVDFSPVQEAKWLAIPTPLHWGLDFPVPAMIAMIIMSFVTSAETIGAISGITVGVANREPTNAELKGGIMADGLNTSLAGIFNGFPNTTYSQNVGLVIYTGLMSRHVVSIGAIVLLVAGVIPKVGAIISTIPYPVLGGSLIIMFGLVAAIGIKLIASSGLDDRNLLIVAISLCLSLGLASVGKPVVQHLLPDDYHFLLTSGVIPVAFISIFLDQLIPKKKQE